MRVPLTQGAYMARSIIANAQRCVNLFAERNASDSTVPFTYYNCPGLTSLSSPATSGAGRGLYWGNNDQLYGVVGRTVYQIGSDWAFTALGTIGTGQGLVSMADNGTTLSLVDGSPRGYQIDLATNVFSEITAATNAPDPASEAVYAFYGANRADALDGYLLFNQPGTRNFYTTYLNEMIFDALYFAAKNGYSDNLVTLIVSKRVIWLIGERTVELWFNAGAPDFPFQIMPGPFIQHGCVAKYSVAQVGGNVFWLSQDQAGQAIVVRGADYDAQRISNHAMETEMAKYPTVVDAEGFCFQQDGHAFYQLNFPTANKSWRWDESVPDQWHEPVWTDANGAEHRHRASCAALAYGKNVCLDWQTGELYALDPEAWTDAGAPMYFRRGFPHFVKDGKQVIYPGFTLDVQAATSPDTIDPPGPFPWLGSPGGVDGSPSIDGGPPEDAFLGSPAPAPSTAPMVFLRWSDDRGKTYGNPLGQSLGATGQYLSQPQWNRLGRARDRVWEIYGVVPGKLAINGAWLDPEPIVMAN